MIAERIAVTHPTLALTFAATTLVDTQTDAVVGAPVNLPYSGYLVAASARLSQAVGAGALSFDLKLGITQQDINTAIGTAETAKSVEYPRELYRFTAGQDIQPTYTSGALTNNGTLTITLLVVLDGVWE